jgi:hypothetical protein
MSLSLATQFLVGCNLVLLPFIILACVTEAALRVIHPDRLPQVTYRQQEPVPRRLDLRRAVGTAAIELCNVQDHSHDRERASAKS